MNFKTLTLIATAGALALPAAASADTLVTAAPGAANLAAAGGAMAWSAPAPDGGFQLTVRAADGTVTTPQIPKFRVAPDPAIGSNGLFGDERGLLVVYSRDGDVYSYDLTGDAGERKVAGASSRTYEETAPSIDLGRMTFVRRGGTNNGVFYLNKGKLTRITTARPRETSFNGSRVAYPSGRDVVIRRISGRGRASVIKTPTPAFGLVLTRYSLTYATSGGRVWQTPRFGGSSQVDRVTTAREGTRRLPATTNSIANESGSFLRFYADAEGVKRISEQHIFPR
jgi:hypothetical protein